jgi:hypothetical protein
VGENPNDNGVIMHLATKIAVRVGAVAVAVAAVAIPATAAHATGPSLTAVPNTGLHDGDSVAVTGAGFTASTAYNVVECSGLTGLAACDTSNVVSGTTGADGSISDSITVHTGTIGNGTCAPGSSNCYVVASTDAGGPDTAFASIAFAALPSVTVVPNTNVKNGSTVTVSGANFPPNKAPLFVLECSGPTSAQCDTGTLNLTGSTDAEGSFSGITVKVHTGAVGTGTCKAGGTCLIAASTSQTPDSSQAGAGVFTFAKAAKTIATKTTAKVSHSKVVGKVKAAGKGVSGLKTFLDRKVGTKWHKVATLHTHKGGKFHSKKLTKSGKYEVKTPKQHKGSKTYGASHSKVVKV